KPGATAELKQEVSGGSISINERTLVNEGTLTFSVGNIYAGTGAVIENSGTFKANSEPTSVPAFRYSSGAAPLIVNTGNFEKTAGTGTTQVALKYENKGATGAKSGKLSFTGGGLTSGVNSWTAAEGGSIAFGGSFSIGANTSWSGNFELSGGTLTASSGLKEPESSLSMTGGSLSVSGGPLKVGTFSLASGTTTLGGSAEPSSVSTFNLTGGTLTGAGTLNVTGSFTTGGTNVFMTGTGRTVVKPGATAELKQELSGGSISINERTLVNEGTLTFAVGNIYAGTGAVIENSGTFKANSEPTSVPAFRYSSGAAPLIVNTGNFEKTAGTGTTTVDINFENLGHIIQQSGHLNIAHPVSIGYKRQFGKRCASGDPIECATGNYTESQADFAIGGRGVGLNLTRTYSAQDAAAASSPGAFGYGWTNSFSDHLISEESGKKITLVTAMGSTITFSGGPGSFTAPAWTQDVLSGSAEAGYTLTLPEQTKYIFSGSGRLESIADRNGNKTSLAYSKSGQLETITDPAGRKITLTYNGEGLVESAKDPMGHVVKYTYESKNLKTVTLPGEASANWQFKYDASHRLTSKTDGRGGETTNEYDSSNRVISQTDPAGRTLTFKYEPFHTTITNQATGAVTDEWFTSNNEPYSITRGYGTADATTEAFSYNAAGRLTSVTDGNGHTTTYGYDAEGNRTNEENAAGDEREWAYNKTHDVISMTTPGGETTTIKRDANGNIESASRPGPEETTQTTTYAHNEHGQLESVTDPLERTWIYGYDSQGNRTSEADPAGDTETFGYDGDSRLTAVVAPRGNVEGAEPSEYETTVERDAQGRPTKITDPLGHATEYGYDPNGNLSTLTDPRGHTIKFTYNADDEQIKVEKPNGTILKTGYDGAGEMTSQTDGNEHTTTYVRNVLEQPVEVVDPLGRQITAEFDAAGNLKSATDPAELTTSYTYDPANRLTKISYSGGKTPATEYGYDADGNLTSMVDGTGESSFVYDQLGRLSSSENGHGDVVGYGYDLASDLTGITYPNGKGISRAFDSAGRLESITDWLGGTTSFTYDPDSNLETITFPAGSGNVDEYSYGRADQLSEAKFMHGAEALASLTYSRDKAGAIESEIREGLPGPEELGYGYDENGRLTEAGEASFKYDAADNLTKGLGSTNTYDAANQLETGTGVSYSYDKLGRRIKATPGSGPATSYEYDQAGNLTSIERPEEGEVPALNESLAYDGSGLLASKTSGMTTDYLTWDTSEGLPLLLDDDQNSYIYGPGGLSVEQISSEEKPTYLHHDQLGSTRLLTSASGEASATFSYGPYGALEGKTGVATTPLGFAGQYTDPETGLQYLRARFYDPATAQFLTRDPLEVITREPYAYAFDSPLNLTDPSGRIAGAAAGCAIGEVVEPAGGCVPGAAAGAAASVAAAGAAAAAGAIAGSLSGDEEILGHLTISKSLAAKLAAEANGNQEAACEPSEMPNFEDSSQPPGPGWEWRGNGPPGSKEGAWHNPETGESLHPDLEHGGSIGPHYDYQPWRNGPKSRVYPDGRVIPKG
ncbi:MAG TPA: RHS repeat-associated core domain-containing protein, partial [Solirubrobacterales bacterium]|nr:RHS repeat-associated core domain-containing protein [Solirubrobacterales bacterium]